MKFYILFITLFSFLINDFHPLKHESELNKVLQLEKENREMKQLIKEIYTKSYVIRLSGYHPVEKETDSTPNITADGTVIDIKNAGSHRYIAISRDFLKSGIFKYGDYVFIKGTMNNKDGIYQIRDTMNKRYKNHADLLLSPGEKAVTNEKILLCKISEEQKNIIEKIFDNL